MLQESPIIKYDPVITAICWRYILENPAKQSFFNALFSMPCFSVLDCLFRATDLPRQLPQDPRRGPPHQTLLQRDAEHSVLL